MKGPDTKPPRGCWVWRWGTGGAGGWGRELGVDDLEGRSNFIFVHP